MKFYFYFPFVFILFIFFSDSIQGQNLNIGNKDIDFLSGKTIDNKLYMNTYEPANEIDFDLTYDSHDSYRGRDNGIIENGLATSVQYQHKSGFGAFIDAKYLSKSKKAIDDYDLGISWLFNVTNSFDLYLSYSHFWYNDSVQVRSNMNNNFESVFDLQTKSFNSNVTLDLDFGGGTKEFTTSFSGGIPLILSSHIFKRGVLTIEPGLTATIGQQDLSLVARRKARGGSIVPKVKKSSTFGIMDYELHIPLTLETKHITVKPQFDLIMPVNVLDLSTKTAFGNFDLEITVPFKF